MTQWRRRVISVSPAEPSAAHRWTLGLECGHGASWGQPCSDKIIRCPPAVDCATCADKAAAWLRPVSGQPYGHVRLMEKPFDRSVWCGATEGPVWQSSASRPDWVCGACLAAWGIDPADPS